MAKPSLLSRSSRRLSCLVDLALCEWPTDITDPQSNPNDRNLVLSHSRHSLEPLPSFCEDAVNGSVAVGPRNNMRVWDTRLLRMTIASVLAGAVIGVVGGAFRWCLAQAEQLRDRMILWSHGHPYIGWIVPVVVTLVAVAIARLLVLKLAPEASGSGVHRVEAIMAGEIKPGSHMVLPVKFVGGLLSLGSGMALGREGPTVQMGASFGAPRRAIAGAR